MAKNHDPNRIVKAAIYPPIGVMRVGNSKDEYFIGPLTDVPEVKSDIYAYRDKTGALKRQAAQFRIYGLNEDGKPVKELTMEEADITWHSQLGNQKSSWYQFQIALDIPEANSPYVPASILRNIDVKDRDKLRIIGKPRKVSKPNQTNGNKFKGKFFSKSVYLGEMRTDEKGRLIMLGGHGVSANVDGNIAVTFANNEGWHDDMSDGPVTAEVKYNGESLVVDPAWVICAPPDYAPLQKSVRTMWDLMRDTAAGSDRLKKLIDIPEKPSFSNDILPIFERMSNLQWVNAGFAAAFGYGGQFNYTSEQWVKNLNDPSMANQEMRRTMYNNFRQFDQVGAAAPQLWPWLYGDAIAIPSVGSPRQHCALSDLQLKFLKQWVDGEFHADFNADEYNKFRPIDEYPIEEQPDMLTKAAMDFCLADAFHPGCEMTWPMRTSKMYDAPFRLKHAPKEPKTDYYYYGSTMDSGSLGLSSGPLLGGQVPGGITRWMAVPWQTDTASCRDGYTKDYDPYLPTFWPARVPNNVLAEEQYNQVMNQNLTEEERRLAFSNRQFWLDDLPLDGQEANQTNQINAMVKYFDKVALVQQRPGVEGSEFFPPEMQVGLTPSPDQGETLVKEATKEIKEILGAKKLSSDEQAVLEASIFALTAEGLFDATMLLNSTKDRLLELLSHDISKDLQQTSAVKSVLSLIASKEHKESGMTTAEYHDKVVKETGVPEQMIRFQRFRPKG